MTEQEFIQNYQSKKLSEVSLLLCKQPNLNKEFIINQINGIQKARIKLPEWNVTSKIIYPQILSLEQCSSEITAKYKNEIIQQIQLNSPSILDLTGGFGVDSYYFSKKSIQVTFVEPNKELFDVVLQNFKTLNVVNVEFIHALAEDFLAKNLKKYDLAYIDPSRRKKNQKLFLLNDCTPNIIDLQQYIFKFCTKILVKTSPLLDIKQSIKELKTVSQVWVVSVNNECKEVLYLLENKKSVKKVKINTVNIIYSANKNINIHQTYHFCFEDEESLTIDYSKPLNFLYEPNSSILKAGAFKSVGKTFAVKKMSINSHLYISFGVADKFPGRIFMITKTLSYRPKEIKKLGLKKANVSCRNFPERVQEVKKKLGLKDGGEQYLFATTNYENKPIIILCEKYN